MDNLAGMDALATAHGASFEFIKADVRDDALVRDAVSSCGGVAHLAAVPSVSLSFKDPAGTNSVTLGGTVNVVRRAVEAGVPRLVLASSCAVYGDAAQLPAVEISPAQPLSPYADAKLASEGVCLSAARAGQLSAACLRFFNVYGPRQDPGSEYSGVISRFMSAAVERQSVTIHGDGRQTRDFIYGGDVAEAVAVALTAECPDALVVNVGTGVQTSLLTILDRLEQLCGHPIERHFGPARAGDIRHSCADTAQAASLLGWRAATPFADGLRLTHDWYLDASPSKA
jgi:UDP-glucose 4-epimerase